ncbi:MAG: hypothetical protein ACJAVK_003165 [Akkermansiaceae bacterium]|jgi:hypothetical protein
MRAIDLLITSLFLSLTACQDDEPPKDEPVESAAVTLPIADDLIHQQVLVTNDEGIDGRRLAIQHCQRCHLFVEPGALPKSIWQDTVLPRMGAFMGMGHAGAKVEFDLGRHPAERQILFDAGVHARGAEMTLDEWNTLVEYYTSEAPERLEVSGDRTPIEGETRLFQEAPFGYRQENANTTLVHIDEESQRLFVGSMTGPDLSILNANLARTQKISMGSAPVDLQILNGDLWVTQIGSVYPSDLPMGEVVVLQSDRGNFLTTMQRRFTGLRRPTYTSYADLNQDGLTDVLMSEFGNQVGAFNYYQARKKGGYDKVELSREPGSMASYVHDFNGDGWLDVAVVHGQNREGVHIHYYQGGGKFKTSYALALPPNHGTSSVEFYDFDGDGHLDILAANGDNGDYRAVLKPHHGVRVYLNDGKNLFKEAYFFPMNGAGKAFAEDFDLDGDLDIAAIAMFPDLTNRPEEGFVYLENVGDLDFRASTIKRVRDGRWLCMDTGDLDGDGDKDIVIGSFTQGPGEIPLSFLEAWQKGALAGMVLWNQTK